MPNILDELKEAGRSTPQPDAAKLREMIVFLSYQCSGQPVFGKTKLAKLLYFADHINFLRAGRTISGAHYVKDKYGPVPEGYYALLPQMVNAGDIAIVCQPLRDLEQQRPAALREPDLTSFAHEECHSLWDAISQFGEMSGRELSELSHGLAWQKAQLGEAIEAGDFLSGAGPVTPDQRQFADRLARHLNLPVAG